ncbi:MAG: HlyC/CorC family transporter [Gemmatimonadetes bacterium]|nr:HlyC/CorC family transporter [Gemmatimonadota bacterium]
MDPASILLKSLAVLILVGINAYFVAAEFALVAVRRTRMESLARAGDVRARVVLSALAKPDDFISAAQLGITAASIGIGYIAEDTIHALLLPYLEQVPLGWAAALPLGVNVSAHALATVLTLGLLTYLHVVLGEQVPKMISIQRAEPVALFTAGPTLVFAAGFRPFIRLMSRSAGALMRLLRLAPRGAHSLAHTPEEIRMLVEQSQEQGMVEAEAEQMIAGVFELRERTARDVMTPRPDVVAAPVDATRNEIVALVTREAHSRFPVYDGGLDNIVGVLLVKDLLPHLANGGVGFDLRRVMREPYFVPDTKRVSELIAEFRKRTVHLAVVVDEFGGTEGIVSLEDLLEEIVGDIYDEHDRPEPAFTATPEGDVLIHGGAGIDEVNERFGLRLPHQDFQTIGGYIFGELGRIPVGGDVVRLSGGGALRVEETHERRVTRVRLLRPGRTVAASQG